MELRHGAALNLQFTFNLDIGYSVLAIGYSELRLLPASFLKERQTSVWL
jgi:hypothetical protein